MTDWLARARTIGAASRINARSGAADGTAANHGAEGWIVQGLRGGKGQARDPAARRARRDGLEPRESVFPEGRHHQARAGAVLPVRRRWGAARCRTAAADPEALRRGSGGGAVLSEAGADPAAGLDRHRDV